MEGGEEEEEEEEEHDAPVGSYSILLSNSQSAGTSQPARRPMALECGVGLRI